MNSFIILVILVACYSFIKHAVKYNTDSGYKETADNQASSFYSRKNRVLKVKSSQNSAGKLPNYNQDKAIIQDILNDLNDAVERISDRDMVSLNKFFLISEEQLIQTIEIGKIRHGSTSDTEVLIFSLISSFNQHIIGLELELTNGKLFVIVMN